MAAFDLIANALTALQEATQTLTTNYKTISVTSEIRDLVYEFHASLKHDLISIESLRWLGDCARHLLPWIRLDLSSPIFLLLVPMLLSLVLRRWRTDKGGRSEKTRIASAPPRCLTRPTTVEKETRFTLARRSRPRRLCGTRHDADHCFTRRIAEGRVMTKPVAARLIQRWVRAKFQPWVLERVAYSANPPRPQSEPDWTDRDAGATIVTLVDHDDRSTIGPQHPGDARLVDIDSDEPESVYEQPMDDADAVSPSSPRCRGAATISTTRLLPSRNQIDGR
ncbi:uncharacterized protein [Dermacentor andersoni]|uniref:uncharacterized protein n=1 Tax=Dermacentor andersoni TaxID=34620 RepID=UPI0024160990|nr:uncharacterized protein LOC129383952 [Dermacentor andersoni]